MYIDPFLLGILTTLLAEFIAMVVVVIVLIRRDEKGKRDDRKQ